MSATPTLMRLLLMLLLLLLLLLARASGTEPPCSDRWREIGSACYYLSYADDGFKGRKLAMKTSLKKARQFCHSETGHLSDVTICSHAPCNPTDRLLEIWLLQQLSNNTIVFVGAHRRVNSDSRFYWDQDLMRHTFRPWDMMHRKVPIPKEVEANLQKIDSNCLGLQKFNGQLHYRILNCKSKQIFLCRSIGNRREMVPIIILVWLFVVCCIIGSSFRPKGDSVIAQLNKVRQTDDDSLSKKEN